MGSVAQLHDPEGDRLIRLAERLGEENLSEGERWRLANTLRRPRGLEARAAQHGGRTDALAPRHGAPLRRRSRPSGVVERDGQGGLGQVIGELIGEAENAPAPRRKSSWRAAHRDRREA